MDKIIIEKKQYLRNKRFFKPIFRGLFIFWSSIAIFLLVSLSSSTVSLILILLSALLTIIYISLLIYINYKTSAKEEEIFDFINLKIDKIKKSFYEEFEISVENKKNFFITNDFYLGDSKEIIYSKISKKTNERMTSMYKVHFIFFDDNQVLIKKVMFSVIDNYKEINTIEYFYSDVVNIKYGEEKKKYFQMSFLNGDKIFFPMNDDIDAENKVMYFKKLLREKKG